MYLMYSPIEYTIEYIDINNENNFDKTTITYETIDSITILDPKQDNKTFIGWYYNEEWTINDERLTPGLASSDNILAIIDNLETNNINSITIYGKFAKTYTITFIVDNDEVKSDITLETNTYQVEENGYFTVLDTLTNQVIVKDNDSSFKYYFDKWITNENNEFDETTQIVSNMTVYASWKQKEITLTVEYGYDIADTLMYFKEGTSSIKAITPYGFKDKNTIADTKQYLDNSKYIIRSDSFKTDGIEVITQDGVDLWVFTDNKKPIVTAVWNIYYKVSIDLLEYSTCTITADCTLYINNNNVHIGKKEINSINEYLFVLENTYFEYSANVKTEFSDFAFKDNYKKCTSKFSISYYNKDNLEKTNIIQYECVNTRDYKLSEGWTYSNENFAKSTDQIYIE